MNVTVSTKMQWLIMIYEYVTVSSIKVMYDLSPPFSACPKIYQILCIKGLKLSTVKIAHNMRFQVNGEP